MHREPDRLASETFDLLVIGGGITGSCIAWDAALRGLAVALVEKDDFGGYTSSASSKLLHGGIRYLPKGQLWKVRESAREQAIFQHLAPHLTRWLPFLIPTDNTSPAKGRLALSVAMSIYGLCRTGLDRLIPDEGKKPPAGGFLDRDTVLARFPMLSALEGLTGARILLESHMYSSERMTLAFVKGAASRGAAVANYLRVERLLAAGNRVHGVAAVDRISGRELEIRARLVVNSAGPFVQQLNRTVPGLRLHHRLTGFSRGVHLVTRQLEPEYAMALTTRKKTEGLITRGGRHFFIIPWRGRSLIGTTNVPLTGELDRIRVTAEDIDDFLQDINEALPSVRLERDDVCYAFTGIYPIIAREIKPDTYQGTGEYQIVDHARKDGISGMVTALGAKFTTARRVAERCVDLVFARLRQTDPGCATSRTRLPEGEIDDIQAFQDHCLQQYRDLLPGRVLRHLLAAHGRELEDLVRQGREQDLLVPLSPDRDELEIEVDLAVRREMALSLDDVIFRRTGLGTIGHPGRAVLDRCAALMAARLGWDREEIRRQKERVEKRYAWD